MAYYQARAGVCRSGVTRIGWVPPDFAIEIGGVDRTTEVLGTDESEASLQFDRESRAVFSFQLKDMTPALWQDVVVYYARPNMRWFGGTLLQVEASPVSPDSAAVHWSCTAVPYEWLLNRFDKVTRRYLDVGVGTMVADILYRCTDGGFRVGYIPSSLGNLTMEFLFEDVMVALQRIADAANATLLIRADRIVDLYDTYPETAPDTVTEDDILHGSFTYRADGTQVRSRDIIRCNGSEITALVQLGDTSIAVLDTSPFPNAGTAICGVSVITYTDRSEAAGPGLLLGVSGVAHDLAEGDAIDVLVIQTDSAAAAALALALGGGLSGQASHFLQGDRFSATEGAGRATADLARFGGPLTDVFWTYRQLHRQVSIGQTVPFAITAPIALSASLVIRSMALTRRGPTQGTQVELWQSLTASGFLRSLSGLLERLEQIPIR